MSAPVIAHTERFTSTNPADFPEPSRHEENWRFTPLPKIREFFTPFTINKPPTIRYGDAPQVQISESDPRSIPAYGTVLQPADRVAALALAKAKTGVSIRVPANQKVTEPIIVTITGADSQSYAHHIIEIGAHASVVLIIEYVGELKLANNLEIIVGEGAQLTLVSINDLDQHAKLLSSLAVAVGKNAHFRFVDVSLGGAIVRTVPTVEFTDQGGHADLFGLTLACAGQHLESRLYVDHSQPQCSSNVLYKNALFHETAHTVWVGDVLIRPTAIATQTYEFNRNLLLAKGARADSVPNLEIETGEILGAGHASTTGRFDEEQLFYLRSRGINPDEARRLVAQGFFNEILEKIPDTAIRDKVATKVYETLTQMDI